MAIPEGKYASKALLNDGSVIIDLTQDTVTADKLASGVTAHGRDGAPITGTNTYDADTSDATAAQAEILNGKTAYVNGVKLTGTMPNRESVSGEITAKTETYTVPQGYHDGSGSVKISEAEQEKIIPANIKKDITILGVTGTMDGTESVNAQSKTVTPSFESQSIVPDSGYDYLSQVSVNAIPVTYAENSAGGYTVTIGG